MNNMEKILSGIKLLNNNVSITYGPKGKNVIIRTLDNEVKTTKDGVTVANNTFSKNAEEQTGIDLVRQSANKSLEDSGDGTTTTIMLAWEAIKDNLINEEVDINDFRNGAETKLKFICEKLDSVSTKDFNINSLALTSSNGNKEIADNVTNIIKHCKSDGIIDYKRSYNQDRYELKSGYTFKRGYLSSKFINDQEKLMFCTEENTKVLICNRKLEKFSEVVDLYSNLKPSTSLLIIAEDYSEQFLKMCLINFEKNVFIIPVKLPEYGDQRQHFLEDISFYTSAKIVAKDFTIADLGSCESFMVSKNETIILNKFDDDKYLDKQINLINKLLSNVESEFGKKKYKERIANLTGTNATIFINGVTESEFEERKDLYDDAIKACQSALKDGVLPGAGVGLFKMYKELKNLNNNESDSFKAGELMVIKLLLKPFEWITGNSELIRKVIEEEKDFMYTYNVKTKKYGLGTDINVLDSCKTVKSCLINAISVALSVLTSNLFINVNLIENE